MRRAVMGGEAEEEEEERCRYKGVRRRRWGKWVSEIRVPGTRERLWLGSYATPQAAAVAHDTAVYFLRGGVAGAGAGAGDGGGGGGAALNFPERAAAVYGTAAQRRLSPRSVQRVASDAGMAADAQLVAEPRQQRRADRAGAGIAQGGAANPRHGERAYDARAYTGEGNGSISTSEQLVSGDISIYDMEIMM